MIFLATVIVGGFLIVGLIGAGGIVYLIRSSATANSAEHEPTPEEWALANRLQAQWLADSRNADAERLLEYYRDASKWKQDEIDGAIHKLYRETGQE